MIVSHWRYMDGWVNLPFRVGQEFDASLVGWHCWVYEQNSDNIQHWMQENMSGEYECTFRFNSGNPMHMIHIKHDNDAALFKLRWV